MRRHDAVGRPGLRRHLSCKAVKPTVESVEKRLLLATFTVRSTSDSVTDTGSLRYAITQSNATPGSNVINFDIAAAGSGVQTIAVLSKLPTITVPVRIDATTERGYVSSPLVELNGVGAGPGVDGLDITAGSSQVLGLTINRFSGEGINLSGSGANTIQANYIGISNTGVTASPNVLDGILVQSGSNGNTISGNTISGNGSNGIYLNGQAGGSGTSTTVGNTITGNFIGTNPAGTLAIGNMSDGIYVQNAPNTLIGGATAAARNIISGNTYGLELYDNSDNSVIGGNYIGTNVTGQTPISNSGDGISLRGISNSTIGYSTSTDGLNTVVTTGNVISGNNYGINSFVIGSSNITIQGNYIGTNATGTARIANTNAGIDISGPTNVTIGGTTTAQRNVISGNTGDGINTGLGATGLIIQGNYIGVQANGTSALGNGGAGVDTAFSTDVVIGGTAAGAGNIIANNGFGDAFNHSGVIVGFSSSGNPILTNSIYGNQNLGIENTNSNAQAAPVLTSAVSNTNTSVVQGSLTSTAGTFLIQFFSTPSVNVSGNAEGKTYLGSTTITITSPNGNPRTQAFTANLPMGIDPTALVTATATPIVGNVPGGTSVFSGYVTATGIGPNNIPPQITGSGSPSVVAAGQDVTETFTITNTSSVADTGVAFDTTLPTGVTFNTGSTSTGAPVVATNGVVNTTIGTLAAGASVTVTLVLTVGANAGSSFTVVGNVTSTSPTIANGQDTASVTTTVSQAANLGVSIISSTNPVQVGQDIVYQVTVSNAGPSDASGVTLVDNLPTGTTFVSAVPDGNSNPTFTQSGQTITGTFGTLTSGTVSVITITVATDANTTASVTNTATVSGDQADPDTSDNVATLTTTVIPSADLAVVSDTAAPTAVIAGNTVTFTIVVGNNGPSPASGVVLTDTLGAGLTFVSGTAPGGDVTASNGVVSAAVGNLRSGTTATVTIVAMTTAIGTLSDSAVVSSAVADPNGNNNAGSASVKTSALSDLAVALSAPGGTGNVGDPLTYTATITNNGPSPATQIVFNDTLPGGATFQSSTLGGSGQGTVTDGVLTINVGTLAPGVSTTVTIVVIPTQAGALTDSANVTLNEMDPNSLNNSATVTSTVVIPSPTLAFDATVTSVNETAGTATILINRIGSSGTEVSVHFSTVAGGNATPGLDYTPVSVIVTFPAGATQESVTVPVLANPFDRTNEIVNLQLDSPTGGAVLAGGASASTSTLRIINLDPVLVGPKVTGEKLYGPINAITAIEIDTTGALDPTTATAASNYSFLALGGAVAKGTVIPAGQVVYNPSTGAILVFPATALPANELFVVIVNGSSSTGVADRAGNPLNSVFGSVAGSNFGYVIARGTNFTYSDANGTAVNVRLTGQGAMDLNETLAGQVERLQVLGANSSTTLSGSVSPKGRTTTIGQILGLGQFGVVKSKLYTPPFYVTTRAYPNSSSLVGPTATDVLIGSVIAPTAKKKKATVRTKSVSTSTSHVHAQAVTVATAAKHPRATVAHAAQKRTGR